MKVRSLAVPNQKCAEAIMPVTTVAVGFFAVFYGCGRHIEVRHHTAGAVYYKDDSANVGIQFRRLDLLCYPLRFPRIKNPGKSYHGDRINRQGNIVKFIPFRHIWSGGRLDGAFVVLVEFGGGGLYIAGHNRRHDERHETFKVVSPYGPVIGKYTLEPVHAVIFVAK